MAAAESNLAAAQASYQELQAGPSESELIQLKATLKTAETDLQQAQWDYDAIAYSDSIGASSQAAALQEATITYEAAKAEYDAASEPASESELQSALSAIQSAQDELDTLRAQPTAADLAEAEAQVASTAAELEDLLTGATESELRSAQIEVEKAQLTLDEANADLAAAQLNATMDGTVISVDVSVGDQISAGTTAVSLSDLSNLELTVNVAEVDISRVSLGQSAEITIDALPEQSFQGIVTGIAPSSESDSGVVNYPVTIQLVDADLSDVRPGMTAVATILDEDVSGSWLVPTTAVEQQSEETTVTIVREGQTLSIPVTVSGTHGEWTIVDGSDLQAGDQALGTITSELDEGDSQPTQFGGGGGEMPMGSPPN